MRLPRWLKKPQAPTPIIFTPSQEAKIAELADMAYETLPSDPIKTSYSLITSPTPLIRRIPVEIREATTAAAPIKNDAALDKRMYKDSVRNVLNNKLRSY